MSSDFTQQQTLGELQKAEQLSLQSMVPPSEVPGYRIEKLLGQGAFGQVWLGRDLNTGRQVAVKFYLHRGGVNWSLLSREVKHLVNMSTGRHIVQVLGVGWEAEPPYYVMEYLENGSLEDLVRAKGALGVGESVALFREIAEGLNYAHGKGVLHCDLKPANVLLDHDWRPRLADFGQSRMSHEQTPSLGTLFYMAPEQADLNALVDSRWDVYALGAILYTMLVGSPPYRSPEVIEKLDTAGSLPERLKRYRDTIRDSKPPQLHYRRQGVDKALCQIVDQCLARRSEQRFSNVQQVLQALQRRDTNRHRRPLYLLGIVGPILLSMLMLMFSARSIGVAKQNSLAAVHQWSLESNQFAAMFAARTLESQIEGLFRKVEEEADRSELREKLRTLISKADAELKGIADDVNPEANRDRYVKLQEYKELESYLMRRIAVLTRKASASNDAAIFSSLFVNDARGTNLAIAFSDPDEVFSQSPVARNFAYRSYFTGEREEGDKAKPASEFSPTTHTHLSATFRSTSTGRWKVAISTPIWPDPINEDDVHAVAVKLKPIGIFVLTINLGDFDLLGSKNTEEVETRFAALVDGRPGTQQGILLQHPILKAIEADFHAGGAGLRVPQIDQQQLTALREKGLVDYRDPAAEFPAGESYQGDWVAAIKQVRMPGDSITEMERTSDLWVLVQERTSFVEAPVTELGTRLQREGYVEMASIVFVVLMMWYFVVRFGKTNLAKSITGDGQNSLNYSAVKSTVDR
jgi:eukaryotic-like serine/threonine-protein kinase